MCKDLIQSLATKWLVVICQDSQCIWNNIFLQNNETLQLEKDPQRGENSSCTSKFWSCFWPFLTVSSHCSIRNKTHSQNGVEKIICIHNQISCSGDNVQVSQWFKEKCKSELSGFVKLSMQRQAQLDVFSFSFFNSHLFFLHNSLLCTSFLSSSILHLAEPFYIFPRWNLSTKCSSFWTVNLPPSVWYAASFYHYNLI